jgi:hypothetical protein
MSEDNRITLERKDAKYFHMKINKDLIRVGKDYIIVELTEDSLMQLGKLAMDIVNSDSIKELTLKM